MVGGDSTTMLWEDSDTSSCSGTGSVLVNAAVSASSSLALVGGDRHKMDKITNLSLDNLHSIQEIMSRGDMVATTLCVNVGNTTSSETYLDTKY